MKILPTQIANLAGIYLLSSPNHLAHTLLLMKFTFVFNFFADPLTLMF